MRTSDYGAVTQVRLRNSLLHGAADACIHASGATAAVLFRDLWAHDNLFNGDEDQVAPTLWLDLDQDAANTGLFAGNVFARATNEADVIDIGAGIIWGPNGTEAGWSTARPA